MLPNSSPYSTTSTFGTEIDALGVLTTCEDAFVSSPIGDTAVVCVDVFGSKDVNEQLLSVAENLAIDVKETILQHDGVALVFSDRRAATLFRLFYNGQTRVAANG